MRGRTEWLLGKKVQRMLHLEIHKYTNKKIQYAQIHNRGRTDRLLGKKVEKMLHLEIHKYKDTIYTKTQQGKNRSAVTATGGGVILSCQ